MKTIFTLVVSGKMTNEERNLTELRLRTTASQKFDMPLILVRSQEVDIPDDAPIFLKDLSCAYCEVGGMAALAVNEFVHCPACGAM